MKSEARSDEGEGTASEHSAIVRSGLLSLKRDGRMGPGIGVGEVDQERRESIMLRALKIAWARHASRDRWRM
jgi:hypothetical protein